jgi:site-specific DNA-methyltransferase (adenine-specific)
MNPVPAIATSHNPDILTCLANLSADEVFTPPKLAAAMLDMLPLDLFRRSDATFLDPVCKSGVFLREIARRLNDGLRDQMPDEQKRVDHILTKQVFGLATSELTAAISRRSVYCSKKADGKFSIATMFKTFEGNIRLPRTKHKWSEKGRCEYCGASSNSEYGRGEAYEAYAYPFTHGADPKEVFKMKFDVVVGNPPYQLKGGAGGSSDASIYHEFVEQAFKLEPRFLTMVIPSRWLAGGRDMDDFRRAMFTGKHISHMVDYTKMSTAFPGVDFEGGVGYFLWERDYHGDCKYTLFQGDEQLPVVNRDLASHDIFIRDHRALTILEKVLARGEPTMDQIISSDTPFGLATNHKGWKESPFKGSVALYLADRGKRKVCYIPRSTIRKNVELIDNWKVLLPEAYGERGAIPALVLGQPILAAPESVCTQTYLVAGPFKSKANAMSLQSYLATRFFRFLVSLRKITQHALRSTYRWVPQQTWDKTWSDEVLYKKYGVTSAEIAYIESMIRPIEGAE